VVNLCKPPARSKNVPDDTHGDACGEEFVVNLYKEKSSTANKKGKM